jgi:hypothetical protein
MNLFNGRAIRVVARQELGTIDGPFDCELSPLEFHVELREIRRDAVGASIGLERDDKAGT